MLTGGVLSNRKGVTGNSNIPKKEVVSPWRVIRQKNSP